MLALAEVIPFPLSLSWFSPCLTSVPQLFNFHPWHLHHIYFPRSLSLILSKNWLLILPLAQPTLIAILDALYINHHELFNCFMYNYHGLIYHGLPIMQDTEGTCAILEQSWTQGGIMEPSLLRTTTLFSISFH